MLEAGAQNLEAVLGPLAEAVVCEAEGTAQYEAAMQRLALPLPPLHARVRPRRKGGGAHDVCPAVHRGRPFPIGVIRVPKRGAQGCMTVLANYPALRDKLPMTIKKRLDASTEALAALEEHNRRHLALFSPPPSTGGVEAAPASADAAAHVKATVDDSLGPETVLSGHNAFKGVLQV